MRQPNVLERHLGKDVRVVLFISSDLPGSMAERGTLSEVTCVGIILALPSGKEGVPDLQRFYPWTAIVYLDLLPQ
jgi:hypothetical protein